MLPLTKECRWTVTHVAQDFEDFETRGRADPTTANQKSAAADQIHQPAEAPSIGSKAMQCLSKLGKYIWANKGKVALGVALIVAGSLITGGVVGFVALGMGFAKLMFCFGVALIATPIAWDYTVDKYQLNAQPAAEEIEKEKKSLDVIKIECAAVKIAFEVHFKKTERRGRQ
jgi:hypothetical protein